MKKLQIIVGVLVGVRLPRVRHVVYWTTPAGSLPALASRFHCGQRRGPPETRHRGAHRSFGGIHIRLVLERKEEKRTRYPQ